METNNLNSKLKLKSPNQRDIIVNRGAAKHIIKYMRWIHISLTVFFIFALVTPFLADLNSLATWKALPVILKIRETLVQNSIFILCFYANAYFFLEFKIRKFFQDYPKSTQMK